MLPMGWNQIRQSRMTDMQQNLLHNHQNNQRMPNQQPYDLFRQPIMPPQQQMFQHQMMGGFGLQDPQMLVTNPTRPPEPDGPPPPSPPAPLPSNDTIPPPPPDDGQWWITEMKNVPSNQHRQELDRMVNEKWFQGMTTSQQIECWQHKLQLINKKKVGSGKTNQLAKPTVISAPPVSTPLRLTQQQPLPQSQSDSGNIDEDIVKAREEESSVKQQVLTFQRQYGEWKKQFDDWKEKHKSHPNKEQFAQYESQWMLWQKQMSDQKLEYDTSLKKTQDRIQDLERLKLQLQNQNNSFQKQGQRQVEFSEQQTNRLPINASQPPRFVNNEPHNHNVNQEDRFLSGQRPPRANINPNLRQRLPQPRPQFGGNQGPGFNQRPRFSAPGSADPHRNRPPFDFEGQRPRFDGPNNGGPRFDQRWQRPGSSPRPRPLMGPRFRGQIPKLMEEKLDYNQDWDEEENRQDGEHQPDFHGQIQGRGIRGHHRGNFLRGGPQGRFPRPPRPGGPGNRMRFRGPRPFFPNTGPRGHSTRPVRPASQLGGQHFQNIEMEFAEDDIPANQNFFVDDSQGEMEGSYQPNTNSCKNDDRNYESNPDQSKIASRKGDEAKMKDWNVSRDMVPLEFGTKKRGKYVNRLETFTVHDIHEGQEEEIIEEEEEETVQQNAPGKENLQDAVDDPDNDYSHYFTDDYNTFEKFKPRGRGAVIPEKSYSGRGGSLLPQEFHESRRGGFGHGRGRMGNVGKEIFPFEDQRPKPPHVLMRESGKYNEKNLVPQQSKNLLGDYPPTRPIHDPSESVNSSDKNTGGPVPITSTATSSAPALNTEKLMQKVKELTNTDVKNLLSAVKSITNSSISEEKKASASRLPEDWNRSREHGLPANCTNDKENEFFDEERPYHHRTKECKEPVLPIRNKDLAHEVDRLTEAELIAAGLDPVSLGLSDEDLLLQEYLLNPGLRNQNFHDQVLSNHQLLRNRTLDPLLQESYLERELLRQEIREMREREEARQREEATREMQLRRALTKPVVQAQKIVETIDYSHGLKKDSEKSGGGPSREEDDRGMPRRHDQREELPLPRWGREPPARDRPYSPSMEQRYRPMSMDERMSEREHGFFPPGRDGDVNFQRGFVPPMDVRMRWPPPSMRSPEPYNPASSVVVMDDVIQSKDPLKKHWEMLDRERESMERRRLSMERRRSSLERMRPSREREEERRDRERSLDRLQRMEQELRDREKMLNERERRLQSPPSRRSRDNRDRREWRPEGSGRPRPESPPRKRMQEERPLKPIRGERRRNVRSRSRSRSRDRLPSPNLRRNREWNIEKPRARSPPLRRARSPRGRSPDKRSHGSDVRDRRRFTSPSGDPSRTRSPIGVKPKVMTVKPVFVRVEDLLNDLARQHRPKRIVVVLRGLPGSGKSHIAKLIRDRESTKGVTPRLLGLDDYFMVENEKFEKDSDTGRIVKRKVLEYEYDAAMEPKYRESLLKAFKKTLEDGFFNFVIVDSINDKVSHFSEFWTAAKKCVFEVYVAELTADVHACEKRNIHKRTLAEIQEIANGWEETPQHMIRLDVRQLVQDSEIQEVEMGDVSNEEDNGDAKDKTSLEQLAGIPQSKWERMEANERLDKLDGITKKKLTSSQQHMAEFLSVTDDYIQRSSAPGKKRVRWADIQEKSEQKRLREVGFVVGNTDWSRLVDGDTHAEAALNRTKFI